MCKNQNFQFHRNIKFNSQCHQPVSLQAKTSLPDFIARIIKTHKQHTHTHTHQKLPLHSIPYLWEKNSTVHCVSKLPHKASQLQQFDHMQTAGTRKTAAHKWEERPFGYISPQQVHLEKSENYTSPKIMYTYYLALATSELFMTSFLLHCVIVKVAQSSSEDWIRSWS